MVHKHGHAEPASTAEVQLPDVVTIRPVVVSRQTWQRAALQPFKQEQEFVHTLPRGKTRCPGPPIQRHFGA